jgi:hypothetical protein
MFLLPTVTDKFQPLAGWDQGYGAGVLGCLRGLARELVAKMFFVNLNSLFDS